MTQKTRLTLYSWRFFAPLLAFFLIANSVVVTGETAVHTTRGEVGLEHHNDHPAEYLADTLSHTDEESSQHNHPTQDCDKHHGCHSHSPMSAAVPTPTIAFAQRNSQWLPEQPAHYSPLTNQPPVPPPNHFVF